MIDARRLSLRQPRVARSLATAATALTALAMLACGGTATPPENPVLSSDRMGALDIPTAPPGIRGTVTQIIFGDSVLTDAPSGGAPNSATSCPPSCASLGHPLRAFLVEERPVAPGAGVAKAIVSMPASARVVRRTATGGTLAAFADLGIGQTVSVWFDGPVLESYPSQARGSVVVIEP